MGREIVLVDHDIYVIQRAATLASLRKVNDFPFYTMTYYGGYGFDEYLKTGADNGPEDDRLRKMLTGADRVLDSGGLEQCSCFTACNPSGEMLFGRNFDLPGERCGMLLHTAPPGAYASASLVELEALGYRKKQVTGTGMDTEARVDAGAGVEVGAEVEVDTEVGAGVGIEDRTRAGVTVGATAEIIKTISQLMPDLFDRPEGLLAAPYVPRDGMNEHGVAVSTLSVPAPEHYDRQGKTCIGRWAPVRLVLDYAKSVDEAVELLSNYSIIIGAIGVHYFIADRSGKSVVVEYWDGGMKVAAAEQNWQTVTNFIISSPEHEGSGLDRYERACSVLEANNGILQKPEAMKLLDKVSKDNTIWSALYNLHTARMQLVLGRNYDNVLNFELNF